MKPALLLAAAALALVALRRFREDARRWAVVVEEDDIDWLSEMRPSVAYAGRN